MKNIMFLTEDFKKALLKVDRVKSNEIFKNAFENNEYELVEQLVVRALEGIGEGWSKGIYSLAQVYMSGLICEALVNEYLPKKNIQRKDSKKIAIASLLDQHALGKKIIYSILRASGYEVIDLGQGLTPSELTNKIIENKIEIILISTLMIQSALKVKEVREILVDKKYKVRIIVGGAPFRLNKELWKQVKADARGDSALEVLAILEKLVNL